MITNEEVHKIAKFSRLSFDEEQIPVLAQQLTKIMGMIDILNQVDYVSILPLTSVCGVEHRMRKDRVISGDITEELFLNVPETQSENAKKMHYYIVPRVVE